MTDPSERGETKRARLDASRARVVLLFVAIAISLASFSSPLWAPRFELKLEPSAITPELGLAYTTRLLQPKLPFPLDVPTDTSGDVGSNLELRENGLLLGAAHSAHEDIRSQGGGRFSHWYDYLYFSTSDGTDPRVNGRAYVATGSARLPQLVLNAVLLADAAIIFFLRRWILALLVRHRRMVAGAVVVGACSAAAMLASGAFGVVNPTRSPPKYPGLVLSIAAHVALGCVLTLAQWAMGAGVARALLPKTGTSYAQIILLGFPLSLFLLAVLTVMALVVPYGSIAALFLWAGSLLPLLRWPIERAGALSLLKVLPSLLVLSFAFGCWMSLLWHGPTAVISGASSGDQIFYSSAVWAITANPLLTRWPNLANEGETYFYANFLFPSVGAALVRFLPLDSFLFLCSNAAVAVLGTGLAIHAYLVERPPLRIPTLETSILVLALISAGRTPYWIVNSPPVACVVPLTVAVWFWTVRGRESDKAASIAVVASIIGSSLSKLTSAGTLVPLALAELIPHVRRIPRVFQIILALLAVASAAYASLILVEYLPSYLRIIGPGMTGIGPRSYDYSGHFSGFSVSTVWPYMAQDAGILLMIVAAFRLVNWREASALTLGLILALGYSFLTWVNFMCVVIILALAAIDDATSLRRSRWLVVAALVLVSPPMIVTDEAGFSSGLVWCVIITAVALVTIDGARPATARVPALQALVASVVLAVTLLMLLAAARGTLVLNSGWPGSAALTPQVRDIWLAVRERVPSDALIFTDQTGRDGGFTTGWNTYVLNGQRQVYIASTVQSRQLQGNPAAREARLQINDDVLAGQLEPAQVKTSRQYGSFFAVVSTRRRPLPRWHQIYANRDYVLYRWDHP
jgi:hypothetical protein